MTRRRAGRVSGAELVAAMVEPPVVAVLAVTVEMVLTGHAAGGSSTVRAAGTRLTAEFPLVAGVTGRQCSSAR